MADKRVAIRLGIVGGQEVTAEFDQIGQKGANALNRIGGAAKTAGADVSRSTGQMRSTFQNTGYQIQDFAVQVAGGTSATRALAQQLPQLLSGFGLWGVILGTVAAIAVPLIGYFWDMGDAAKAASDSVKVLAQDVDALKAANANYTTAGIDALIERYGVLDLKIMGLVARQRQFALDKAMTDAKAAAQSLEGPLDGIRDYVTEIADIDAAKGMRGATLSAVNLRDTAAELKEEFGLTVAEAQGIVQAMEDAKNANSLGEMADATSRLAAYLQDSSLKGTEFAGTLIDAEANMRALNNEASKTGGWLAVAADWASGLAARLWDGAKAAAAIRAAQAAENSPLSRYNRMVTALETGGKGRGQTPSGPPTAHSSDGTVIDISTPKPGRGRGVGGGGGGGGSRGGGESAATAAQNQLEKEAKQIYDATRTSAEKYAKEMETLNAVKKAGLIDGDTYNRQVDALGEKYDQQIGVLDQIQKKLKEIADDAKNSGAAIADAVKGAFDGAASAVGDFVRNGKLDIKGFVADTLASFAELAARKYILGPLANALSGALGGGGFLGSMLGATVSHEGSMAGHGVGRMMPASAFIGARRFHNGGLAGDEVAAVLRKGERVLNREQTQAYDRGGSGGNSTVIFQVKDAQSIRQSRTQMAADAARILTASKRAT